MSETLRLAACCAHPVTSMGLRALFDLHRLSDCQIADTLDGAIFLCKERNYPLMLLDVTSSFDLAMLRKVRGAAGAKIVLWVDAISPEQGFQALELGARGILKKDLKPEALLKHLADIQEGHLFLDKELMNGIGAAKATRLTRRESQLVEMLAQGLKNKEIAYALQLTENTIKAYLSRLFQKLGVKDRLELALYGMRNATAGTNYFFRPGDAGMHPPAPEAAAINATFFYKPH